MEARSLKTGLLAVSVMFGTFPGHVEAAIIYDFKGYCRSNCTGYVTGELRLTNDFQVNSFEGADKFLSWTFNASNILPRGASGVRPYSYTVTPELLVGTFHFLHGINSDGSEAYSLRINSGGYERPSFELSGWMDPIYPDYETWQLSRYPPTSSFTQTHSGYWSTPFSGHYSEELYFRRRAEVSVTEPNTAGLITLGLLVIGFAGHARMQDACRKSV